MSKYNFSEIKDWAQQVHFYEHDAWMGEYNIDEVGEYLEQFRHVSSGERNWYEKGSMWYPSRADFIIWKRERNQKGKKK